MKATFEPSPRPNHKRNIGRNASGGIGRTNSMTGSSMSRSGAHSAASVPSVSAAAAAMPKPCTTRASDVSRLRSKVPSRRAATVTATTSPGVGRSTGFIASTTRLP